MSNPPTSNCYGFVYAGLHNREDDFYLSREDLNLPSKITKKKIQIDEQVSTASSEILELLSEGSSGRKVIELFDHEKRSQHVAFLDED